jgi:histidine triad (HIT) family protein
MSDIFDKIIDGSIPSYKVYEDDNVLAFLDLTQATPGHTLVVPKKHVADIFEYDDELAAQVLGVLPKIAQAIKASDEILLIIMVSTLVNQYFIRISICYPVMKMMALIFPY